MNDNEETKLSPLLIITIAILIPIIPFIIIGELPGENWLSDMDDNAFLFGLTGSILLASDIFLPIPSTIIGTMLGARLGFFSGLLWTWSGLVLGSLAGYYCGKLFFPRTKEEIPQSPTLLILAISRPVPILAEAVSFTAGASGTKLPPFLFISIIANGIFAVALAGNGAALFPNDLLGYGLIFPMLLPAISWLIWQFKYKTKDINNR